MNPRAFLFIVPVLALPAAALAVGPRVIYSSIQTSSTSDIPGQPGAKFRSGTNAFSKPFVSPDGSRWALRAFNNTGSTTDDEFLFSGSGLAGTTVVRENFSTGLLSGEVWNTFDEKIGIDNSGNIAFSNNTSAATTQDELVARYNAATNDFTPVAREGNTADPIPGATYGLAISTANITADGRVFYLGSSLTGVPTANNAALFGNSGGSVVAQKGITIPGGASAPWELFDTDDFRINSDGTQYLAKGDLTGTTNDDVLVRNGTVVMQEGSVIPGSTFTSPIASAFAADIFMSATADWMVRGSNADTIDWATYNGAVIAVTDNAVPGGMPGENWDDAPFASTFFFITANNSGGYVVGGTTNNPDATMNAVLAYGTAGTGLTTVFAREGDAVDVDGNGLFDDNAFLSVFNNDDGFLLDNGKFYFTAELRDAAGGTLGQAFLTMDVPAPGAAAPFALLALAAARRRR